TVEAGVSRSDAQSERDQRSGQTTASSESDLANACVQPDPVTGACAVGGDAVHSEGLSDSGNSPGSASRDSYVASLDLGNEEQGRIEDPQTIAAPPDCPAGASLLCVFLNQGETYVGDGIAGHAQEALGVTGLPGILDVNVELGRTDTLVHNDGGEPAPPGTAPGPGPAAPGGPGFGGPGAPGGSVGGDPVGSSAGVLPNTGGVWSGLLAIALFMIGAGAFFVAYSRRQVIA
ncbi:MAG: LPXTG cell wall anchor domain-containing protein, partial [Actinomycetes bacterium]